MTVASKLAHQHQAMLMNQSAKKISRKALFSKEGGLGSPSFSDDHQQRENTKEEKMRRIPVTIQTTSRSISAVKGWRGLGSDAETSAINTSGVPEEASILVTETEVEPSIVEVDEEYVVTTDAPVMPEEEVAVVETFAAEAPSATTPPADFIQSVLQTFQAETLKSITDNIVKNSSTICENASIFFKNVFLVGCDITLGVHSEQGMIFDVSVLVDTKSLTTGKEAGVSAQDVAGVIQSQVGEILINSNEFSKARRNIRTTSQSTALSITFDLVEHPSIATGIALSDPTTALVKCLCESLLVAIGASTLGQEFEVFSKGSFSPDSAAGLAYKQSVFSGAMAISLLNRNAEAKHVIQKLVNTFAKNVSEVLACPAELSNSLDSVYAESSVVDVPRETLAVDDSELLLMFGTDEVAFSISNSQALQLTEDIVNNFIETLQESVPSLVFSQLKLQALEVESATVSLVNAFSAALTSLSALLSLLPSNLVDAPTRLEEAQADISRNVFELKDLENESDLLLQEYMLYLSSPISYMSSYLEAQSSKEDLVAEIVADLFEKEVGESIYDSYSSNPTNVGLILNSDDFNLAVEDAVVQKLNSYVTETVSVVEAIQDSAGTSNNVIKGLLSVWAQPLASAISPEIKAKVESFVNQHGPQVQDSLERTVSSAKAHVDVIKDNASLATSVANRKRKEKVSLSGGVGMGTKVAIGAVLGAALYLGAKHILKRK